MQAQPESLKGVSRYHQKELIIPLTRQGVKTFPKIYCFILILVKVKVKLDKPYCHNSLLMVKGLT